MADMLKIVLGTRLVSYYKKAVFMLSFRVSIKGSFRFGGLNGTATVLGLKMIELK